jgi:ubiquinone/menaquinone biosynthesis C-methylase UbiE
MPYANSIRYEIGDFTKTRFDQSSFRAITSISVIEHGFNGDALLSEMSRLLRQGEYFIASFDYGPEEIDTAGVKFFGMDWKIFSKDDVAQFIDRSADYGLLPVGTLTCDGREKAIDFGGRQYTFAWVALRKVVWR